MHKLNPYFNSPPNFYRLCQKDSILAKLVNFKQDQKEDVHLNFKDSKIVRALTEATLRHDFGIEVKLREDRLCPIIPNRLDYLAWIEEILQDLYIDELREYMRSVTLEDEIQSAANRSRKRRKGNQDNKFRILDVGTGSLCIYSILGCALHQDYDFIGTDIDAESIRNARTIIMDDRNNENLDRKGEMTDTRNPLSLGIRIKLLQRTSNQPLLLDYVDIEHEQLSPLPFPTSKEDGLFYHISMCNPPFYASQEEMDQSLRAKEYPPNAVCNGSTNEMICEGGELAFVIRMIKESKELNSRVIWFTSLIGKRVDVDPIVEELYRQNVSCIRITDFIQGKTKRWAVAWTFTAHRSASLQKFTFPSKFSNHLANDGRHVFRITNVDCKDSAFLERDFEEHLKFSNYFVSFSQKYTPSNSFIIFVDRDSWSRKARRTKSEFESKSKISAPVLGVRVTLQERENNSNVTLEVDWIYGKDRQLFNSFSMSVLGKWAREN